MVMEIVCYFRIYINSVPRFTTRHTVSLYRGSALIRLYNCTNDSANELIVKFT